MTVYAIQHIPTKGYLPMRFGKSRGFSFDEPATNCVPRVFPTAHAAGCALRAWLKGKWEPEYETNDWDYRRDKIGASPVAVAGRKAEDMSVVAMTLESAE